MFVLESCTQAQLEASLDAHFACTLGSRQGAQLADPCSKSLTPSVPIFQHAQKNKVKRKVGIWFCLRKKRAKKHHSPQDSIALLACCGTGRVPVGHGKRPPASPSLRGQGRHGSSSFTKAGTSQPSSTL